METISLNEREQAVLNEMSGDVGYPFATLSEWSGIPTPEVRLIVRDFRKRGLADFGTLYNEDDYCVCGSGYWLTDAGWDLKTKMELE